MDQNGNSLTNLCAVSAREMTQLQAQVQGLEDAVFSILESDSGPTSKDRQALQDFDLVAQTLAGLAGFFQRVQVQNEDTGRPDLVLASEQVTLQKLRDRLRGPIDMNTA
ncbi:hypothetical protein FEE96_12660 [Parasedimentitalea maritima]|uniref:Uncharacterized protein n=1 Tax=Parasedimentitalea maritima TaxID=2578117 RepID=A0A5R8Z9T9_9RHOB|nr:hypothetical protein [Zongyanglinia marina]KAE9629202.1 hypothetical protein GP644_12330 [Zongyanglinia marina]TLP62588.1 hypothetical protein FEE96_12660 [Zongyanglinia marina]